MKKMTGSAIIMMMGSALIAGCGVSSAASAPSAQGANSHRSAPPASATSSSTHRGASSRSTSASVAPSANAPSAAPASPAAAANSSNAGVQLVKAWMQSGLRGEGLNMPIGDGKTIGAVERAWGNGQSSSAGAGLYVTYPSHRAAFGVGSGDQIFDVRSDATNIQQVTRQDVLSALGTPGAVRYADNTTIYMYPDGPSYQMQWTFSGGAGHTGNTVEHVSVFWPQGTVDLMGQTLPNPTVVVTTPSASSGSYISFAIQNAPSGYRLDELEWLPSGAGTPVVNTNAQALYNGQHGVSGAVFLPRGGAYHLQFTPAMRGSLGQIRLIYESPSGNAIIGTSSVIHLP